MIEERRQVNGHVEVRETYNLWGSIGGNVTVHDGGKMYVRGTIVGNLIAEEGGRVHIFGTVNGNLVIRSGAKVVHSGVLHGDAVNQGGRLYVERCATIIGRVKTHSGSTVIEPDANIARQLEPEAGRNRTQP